MLGTACVESVNGLHCGEEQNVPDGGGIGQEHDDPVDAETDAAGGGIPYSSAAMKFSSMGIASSSPFAFSCACCSKRARWSMGSFSSLKALQYSAPAMKSSKRSTIPGLSGLRFVSGETSTG